MATSYMPRAGWPAHWGCAVPHGRGRPCYARPECGTQKANAAGQREPTAFWPERGYEYESAAWPISANQKLAPSTCSFPPAVPIGVFRAAVATNTERSAAEFHPSQSDNPHFGGSETTPAAGLATSPASSSSQKKHVTSRPPNDQEQSGSIRPAWRFRRRRISVATELRPQPTTARKLGNACRLCRASTNTSS